MADYVLVRHKVRDFNFWKKGFESDSDMQKAAGLMVEHVTRNIDDPSEVVILFKTTDVERARGFGADERLKQVMQQYGVIDVPNFFLLREE